MAEARKQGSAQQVTNVDFAVAMRGYDRNAVDSHLVKIAKLVEQLEANQLPETVVQQALSQAGEQTSGILQRANETAGEIESQARSQAEGHISRAEAESAATRQEADAYADQIAEDTARLWDERQRLIEEMRQFAEDVLGVADEALERVPGPPGSDADEDDDGVSGLSVVRGAGEFGDPPPAEEEGELEDPPEDDDSPDPDIEDEPGDQATVEYQALDRPDEQPDAERG
jgi:DivIVA domain-containing protein